MGSAVLNDPGRVASMTISRLATECGTSETTVVRFCRSMGLKGYPELRVALASEAACANTEQGRQMGSDIGPDDVVADVVSKVCFADARAIEETASQLDTEVLAKVASAAVRSRRIDIFGVGASSLVALDLQQKLHRVGHTAFAFPDPNIAITSAALLGAGDLLLAISHTGSTLDTLAVLKEAKSVGATVAVVTNFPKSPLAQLSDHVLTTAARETTFRSGAMASRVAQLSVVDCLFAVVAQHHYLATLRALDRTREAVSDRRLP